MMTYLHDVLFVVDAKALDDLSSRVGEDLGSKFMDWATKVTGEATRKNMEIYAGKVSNIRTIMTPVYFFYTPDADNPQFKKPLEWLDDFVAFIYKKGKAIYSDSTVILEHYRYLKVKEIETESYYPATRTTTMEMSVEGMFGNSPIVLGNNIIQKDLKTGLFDIDMGSLFISPSNVNKVIR